MTLPHAYLVLITLLLYLLSPLDGSRGLKASKEAYWRYLKEHGKESSRIHDDERYQAFSASIQYINDHYSRRQTSQQAHESGREGKGNGELFYYDIGLNEMSDWLPTEVPSSLSTTAQSDDKQQHAPQLRRREARALYIGEGDDLSVNNIQELSIIDNDDYDIYLDWAGSQNPFNRSICGPIKNQGRCGACWSFVATSAIQASVYMTSRKNVQLSEQELIDCDTFFNRGCQGGNPIYAFDYVSTFGLTSELSYPYLETQQQRCKRDQHASIAAIHSYIRLPVNDLPSIKRYLQIGPIAAGICGNDMSFLYYTGGIFSDLRCCNDQNHAVLIVGYGYHNVLKVDYLILKNSWGAYWGENGYMRLLYTGDDSSDDSSDNGSDNGIMDNDDDNGKDNDDNVKDDFYSEQARYLIEKERKGQEERELEGQEEKEYTALLRQSRASGICGFAQNPSMPLRGLLLGSYKSNHKGNKIERRRERQRREERRNRGRDGSNATASTTTSNNNNNNGGGGGGGNADDDDDSDDDYDGDDDDGSDDSNPGYHYTDDDPQNVLSDSGAWATVHHFFAELYLWIVRLSLSLVVVITVLLPYLLR